jgi:hypothetical protein
MLSRLLSFLFGVLVTLALLFAVAAFAQEGARSFIAPTVIDIQQSVPVEAQLDGVSVPITANVALRVSLSGPLSMTVNTNASHQPQPNVIVSTLPVTATAALPVNYEEIARYTEKHIGEYYTFQASVYDVRESDTKLSISIEGAAYDRGKAVLWRDSSMIRVLPDDVIDVTARLDGRTSTGYGDKPEFTAVSIELAND